MINNHGKFIEQPMTSNLKREWHPLIQSSLFSRGHASLHLAVLVPPSVSPSKIFLNCERLTHYCSCPNIPNEIAVYPALFKVVLDISNALIRNGLPHKETLLSKRIGYHFQLKGQSNYLCHIFQATTILFKKIHKRLELNKAGYMATPVTCRGSDREDHWRIWAGR